MQVNNSYNPTGITGIGDPYVLHATDGKYYLYATTFEPVEHVQGFNVWVSDDLRIWSKPKQCYKMGERSFGYANFWAPEVTEKDGKFYMYYSASSKFTTGFKIGVAIADNPLGPFIDYYDKKPMFDFGYSNIDGHVFIDDDGKKYFYYSRDCTENVYEGKNESHIYVAEMSDDLLTISNPVFLLRPDVDYDLKTPGQYRWNEGPFVVKKDGYYYLFYSSNLFATKEYSTCYAVSKRPDGDFVKAESPLITYIEGKVSGPGHNSVTDDGHGNLLCVYHVHTHYDKPGEDRQMFIDRLYLNNGKARVDGPTYREDF